MAFDRVAEVEALLAVDEHREGRLWRWYRDGKTDAEWKVANNVKTAPTNAKHTIEALCYGMVPKGPSYANVDATTIRRWIDTKRMSNELTEVLTAQLRLLEKVAGDPTPLRLSKRGSDQLAATRMAEAAQLSGVYVYSLPHYLTHSLDPETGRTLLKVGHSSVDVFSRVASQSRTTALPEDPILLRIYQCDSSAGAEANFHDWLTRAGHTRPRATIQAGTEWFLTTVDFLDDIAVELGLDVQVVNQPGPAPSAIDHYEHPIPTRT